MLFRRMRGLGAVALKLQWNWVKIKIIFRYLANDRIMWSRLYVITRDMLNISVNLRNRPGYFLRKKCHMKRLPFLGIIGGLTIVGLSIAIGKSALMPSGHESILNNVNTAKTVAAKASDAKGIRGRGIETIEQASKADKYLFAFFWKTDSEQTTTMKKVFEESIKKAADRALSVQICVKDPSEKGIVEMYRLDRAPMPLALAIAPNGAIMGGFPQKFTEEDLLDAFGSPCTERCMKLLQDNKLVLLCVQSKKTTANEEALRGVREFKADSRLAGATEIVMLNPTDPAERSFLNDLKIDSETAEAVTAFLVPPGSVIAEFKGAIDKSELVSALEKASSGCCPGGACGPNGCGSKQ